MQTQRGLAHLEASPPLLIYFVVLDFLLLVLPLLTATPEDADR